MPGRLVDTLERAAEEVVHVRGLLEGARSLESTDLNRRDLSIAITSLEDAELRILRIQTRLA